MDVSVLRDPIRNLLSLYTPLSAGNVLLPWEDPLDGGDRLTDLVQEDWEIFSDGLADSDRALDLLSEIDLSGWEKDSGDDVIDKGDLYTRRGNVYHSSATEAWEAFCEDVRRSPDADPDFSVPIEDELFKSEARITADTILFRGRPGCDCDDEGNNHPFVGADIGAPPIAEAKPARLSRACEVLLYCAEQEATVIGEIRPWRGLIVTVARFRARKDLIILDLSTRLSLPNPFTTEQLGYEIEMIHLINGFGNELSLPLERPDDRYGYLPSQKLSDIIRSAGFDGVRYRSAMAPGGTNVALYDPGVVEFVESHLLRVTAIQIASEDA